MTGSRATAAPAAEAAPTGLTPARIDRAGVACLLVATVGWGLNWPIVKLLLQEWPPLFARGSAGLAAAAVLAALAMAKGERLAVPRGGRARLAWAAFTNVFAFMGFSTLALLWLKAGEAALLVYTMPVWAVLLAWPVLGVRPSLRSAAALVLCLAGTLILFGDSLAALDAAKLPGVAIALAGAVLFAMGTVTGRGAAPLPPIANTAWQVALGSAPMIALSLAFEHPRFGGLSAVGVASWLYMTAVPMGLCYLAWFAAIRRLSPSTAATGSLLVPLIGVLAAAPILGEPITPKAVAALVLVLSGVALVVTQRGTPLAAARAAAD
ncbi:DMT family transporter [Hansschlegelia sp.]|uniref:DMT family transporter n=1 Tax=Hansschlegelia sp. TaxID=2041892 RepID=UPI002BAAC579|nr:DMT family transporter [Hansschlegelia sp.]HVI30123.1 DMT family transporter [Hansschlegelia sp.]